MRTKYVLILVLGFCAVISPFSAFGKESFSLYATKVPEDLKIVAVAGGVAPWESVDKVEIGANGEAACWQMSEEDRPQGVFKPTKTFKIGAAGVALIYDALRRNDFFALRKEYIAHDVVDGSFAELTVTADGRTYTVRTQNMAVKEFDNIMIMINIALPRDNQVLYNEILE